MRKLTLLLALLVAGCDGAIGEPGGPDDGGILPGTDPTDPRLLARAWRLTPTQYNTELQRLFPGAPEVNLPEGSSEFGLTNISIAARIDQGNASTYNEAARSTASWVVTNGAGAAKCTTFGTPECIDTFLGWAPEAAYRRPLDADEKTELRGVYDDTVGTYGPEVAFASVVRALLLSPQFLYRFEIGGEGADGIVELDDYEIASLMAFSLTDAAPDAELLADAKAGKLKDPAIREDHARRLMDRSSAVFQRFFWEWLKMSTLYSQGNETGLDPTLVANLEAEYRAFVDHIVVQNRGTLKDLLTTGHTWATADVADYYGITHPGGDVAQVDFDPAERGGVLTLGAWLVAHGKRGRDNVVRRGMAIYRDAMCNNITPLMVDLEAAQREIVGADATIKEIAAKRSTANQCGGCHATSDPVGLAFESYGGDGKWQTTYADGKPVEATTELNGTPIQNPPQLVNVLAEDERFQQCLVQRFGHFVMGAEFGSPGVVRASEEAYAAFHDSGGSFEELLVAVVRDPSFIERRKQ